MTLGPLMIDLEGTALTREETEILQHPAVGGVILFKRNYQSPQQVDELCRAIHALRSPRLLIGVDHEGGRVQRFHDGFTRLPPMERLGQLYDQNRRQARQLAEKSGWLMAVELRAVDVDFSFAPVLDLDRGICEVIGDRAIHSNPEIITILAHDYMHGMHQAGMAAVGKHFPGHGCVEADTHHAVATDQRHYEDIFAEDLLPYERMIQYGLAGVMTAHVVYPAIDSQPATFSSFWLRDVLRQRLGFQGVIFSDDLSMHAAEQAGDMPARVTAALAAGCDMVLVCNDRQGVIKVLDEPPVHDDAASHMRLVRMHGTHPLTLHELQQSARWMDTVREVLHYA